MRTNPEEGSATKEIKEIVRAGKSNKALLTLSIISALIIIITGSNFSMSFSVGPNYHNVTVDTRVNITSAYPEILQIIINNGTDVTLVAGSTKNVSAKVVIRDYDGGNTITNVTAIFYDNYTKTAAGPADNNDYYGRVNCTVIPTEVNGYYANFTCDFDVYYYANPGDQWILNVTVTDTEFNPYVNVSRHNTTTILSLYALNVTNLIDYGNLAVTDTSGPQEANVTNFGNTAINISVKGYGAVEGDGLAFVCEVGNITIENEKFSLNETGDFSLDYQSLNTTFKLIPGLTLPQQTDDTQPVINSTYWRLYVPPNPYGVCNGSIVFQAEAA